ncbi:bisphosphate nucleotidase [Heterostelium album PN500]|uniref:3'(2'),5'-bisphosphate nucleotidase 1 n=1 Tax=Heterostelium pallidum (strain ATCC 26659 / Pp 5 / PN500) TaxID=670386 RepID=D3BR38_HETP5|nr:bisphosphate nucleotidase [Heterostelium album PN500]EFA75870.1 bisphosphate nucleotidase [Heterostelium album PN500]|eukprot:XP_020428004.1 bisphosphate nucleotidase [Heterostelium album PN500]
MSINLVELVSVCLELAEQSGDIIRNIYRSGSLDVKYKGVDDPVTIADITVQKHIVAGLRCYWPELRIIGEEELQIGETPTVLPSLKRLASYDAIEVPLSELIVFIDPLDATREFTLGNVQCVMTLIGISRRGSPIAGVIHQPFVDVAGDACENAEQWVGRSVYGIVGIPVVGVRDRRQPEDRDKIILATTASHYNEQVDRAVQLIKPDKVIRAGGAGFKALMVIERLADVYVFPTVGMKYWDICAPHAILSACGGHLTNPAGNNIDYSDQKIENKDGVKIKDINDAKTMKRR